MAKKKGVIEAAVDAAEELGAAASAFKESWEHVKKARQKGAPATRAVARAGRTTVRAAKNAMPGGKKRR